METMGTAIKIYLPLIKSEGQRYLNYFKLGQAKTTLDFKSL